MKSALVASLGCTEVFEHLQIEDLKASDVLAFASASTEARGRHHLWATAVSAHTSRCLEIDPDSGGPKMPHEIVIRRHGTEHRLSLRDDAGIAAVFGGGEIILDVSGLANQTWAAILRTLVRKPVGKLRLLYIEPVKYRTHATPATLGSFDLSVRFEGVRPLPGFLRLARGPSSARRVFVPLLGFEGSRPQLVHAEVDPPIVVPVAGLPGFRFDFPGIAIACNQDYLEDGFRYRSLRWAESACPFDLFRVLADIAKDEDSDHLQIAPLGTKPHAIGALLYALLNEKTAEVFYDHPVRRDSRTEGIGRAHIYNISQFISAA